MHYQKTFDAILATPVSLYDLIPGELLWGTTKSLIYGTIIIFVITAGGLVDSWMIIFAIVFVFLTGIIFSEISIIVLATVPGIDSFNYFYTLFMTPLFLFSGIFFPIDGLSEFITTLAFFNPLYHTVEVIRAVAGGNLQGILFHTDWLVIAGLILSIFPFKLMKKRLIR